MSLTYKKNQDAGNTYIQFSGSLDENAGLPDNSTVFPGDLVLDLENVNPINSLGCRNWVLWIKSVKAEGAIKFVKCSPAVIGQANVLSGLFPAHAQVESLFVPYVCSACNLEYKTLVNSKDVFVNGKIAIAEEIPCAKCGGSQLMNISPKSYFNFLRK